MVQRVLLFGLVMLLHGLCMIGGIGASAILQKKYVSSAPMPVVWVTRLKDTPLAVHTPNALEHAKTITKSLLQATFADVND